jgi:hypothetical protein
MSRSRKPVDTKRWRESEENGRQCSLMKSTQRKLRDCGTSCMPGKAPMYASAADGPIMSCERRLTMSQGIVKAFVEILTSGSNMFCTVLRHVLATVPPPSSKAPAPGLFMHCTTGNNRTGVFISMLLLLLQVPHDVISKEYALSDQGLAPTRHINVDRLLKKGAFAEYGPEEARRKCERMVGAREESMRALMGEVERRWGGAEGYFRHAVGLTDEEVKRVKELLTADGEA